MGAARFGVLWPAAAFFSLNGLRPVGGLTVTSAVRCRGLPLRAGSPPCSYGARNLRADRNS
eukprot:12918231-Alexandrium_andersonii.AAC.1